MIGSKKINICLRQKEIDKIEKELERLGKNPDKKKSEFIRDLISSYDSDEIYFRPDQVKMLADSFENIVRDGINLNQLLYHINIEHIEFLKGNDNNYKLDKDKFTATIHDLHSLLIETKEELRNLAKQKRIK